MHQDSTPETPYGFCHCGCGEPTKLTRDNNKTTGDIKGEPRRFIVGHHTKLRTRDAVTPDLYSVDPDTGCWNWNLSKFHLGYGRIRHKSKDLSAHVWVYTMLVGPIPNGRQLDHLCRNKACVNPDHLEPVTASENVRRGPQSKINRDIAALIRAEKGTRLADTAERYGVSKSLVSLIQLGKLWTD